MKGINTNKKVTAVIYAVMIMLVTTTVAIGVYDFNIKTGTITVDNKSQEVKTKKTTVGEVLEEQQITLDDNDYINIPENKKIEKDFNIKIKKAIPVTVSFRGKQKNVKTSDTTVKDVLKSNSMTYYENDEITPALETKVTKDMKITVTRYEQKTNIVEEEIEFETQENENAQLQKGKSLTVQEGSKGIKENTVKELYKNGELISTETTESKVVKEPVTKIIQNGTKVEEVKVASRAATDSKPVNKPAEVKEEATKEEATKEEAPKQEAPKQEAPKQEAPKQEAPKQEAKPAPAKEEAPVAKAAPAPEKQSINSNQSLKGAKSMVMKASAYSVSEPGMGNQTANGTYINANSKVIAVDPKVIKLGSTVMIEGYGTYIAADTGGAIKGNRIDIHMPSVSACMQFGRREVKVYILD